jgi:ABC-2 type transport system ATP-binding protein
MRIEARNLDKHFRKVHAVQDLSFTVEPGRVTGFLGPNGSGKSTTMRLMLGLDNGGGETLFDDQKLTSHSPVSRTVGAHLDAKFFHPKRSAYSHLRMLGAEAGISKARVNEVLKLVGLESVAKKRPGGFSLGMGQRLGLAGAILADPQVLMLDEPANGLDPQSIQWLRDFLKYYASTGKSVLVLSLIHI